jgi:hypothetical protein
MALNEWKLNKQEVDYQRELAEARIISAKKVKSFIKRERKSRQQKRKA